MPDSVIYATVIAVVLLVCRYWRRGPASPGPDSEELSGVRLGAYPTIAPVVSGGPHLDVFADAFEQRLESAPADDRALDLSQDMSTNVLLAGRSSGVVRSTAAGAPAVLYTWRRPGEARRLIEAGWELEFIEPEYGSWLLRKEERWP